MAEVSESELQANLALHLDRVLAHGDELVVRRKSREPVVVVPLSELDSLRETLHLLSTPANAEHLLGSIRELDLGKGVELTLRDA